MPSQSTQEGVKMSLLGVNQRQCAENESIRSTSAALSEAGLSNAKTKGLFSLPRISADSAPLRERGAMISVPRAKKPPSKVTRKSWKRCSLVADGALGRVSAG